MKTAPSLRALAMGSALALPLGLLAAPEVRAANDMTAVLEAEIVTLDPHATAAYITRTFGFMVFDMLFGMDGAGEIRPQMVDSWTVSDDQLVWSFKLREGLAFHDGAPVTSEDVVASLGRWMPLSMMGRLMVAAGADLSVDGPDSFSIRVDRPFPLMATALGHPATPSPFIMPARLAETRTGQPLPEIVGSGPFVFAQDQHKPGDSMVLKKNEAYVSRSEPNDHFAGAKPVNIDKLTIKVIPDALTAATALSSGELDYMQYAPFDMLPIMETDPQLEVINFKGGNMFMGYYPLNHRNPPFDDPAVRQVLYKFIDQTSVLTAMGLSEQYTVPGCASYVMCDMPLESTAGSLVPATPSIEEGRAALAASPYKGEEVIVLQATDLEAARVSSAVLAEWMRQVGFNVRLDAMDWASVLSRRTDEKVWHAYGIHSLGVDLGNPLTNTYLARNCTNTIGWYCSEELGEALVQFQNAATPEARKTAVDAVSVAAYQNVTAPIWGQFAQPAAVRKEVEGLLPSAIPVFWNVSVTE